MSDETDNKVVGLSSIKGGKTEGEKLPQRNYSIKLTDNSVDTQVGFLFITSEYVSFLDADQMVIRVLPAVNVVDVKVIN